MSRQESDAFAQLEHKVTRFLARIERVNSIRDSLDVALDDPAGEVEEAAAMAHAASELAKAYKQIGDACKDFLKHALPEGSKANCGQYQITHYTRQVFDKTSWEHFAKRSEETAPWWEAYQQLESYKKEHKGEFQYVDSSVRVTFQELAE